MACDGQVSSGGVCDIGLHVVWCAKYRRHVLTGLVAARLRELADVNGAKNICTRAGLGSGQAATAA